MESSKYRLTERGLYITGSLSYDEWKSIGERVARLTTGIQWAIGDWLLALPQRESWEETLEVARDLFPHCWQALRKHLAVAEAFRHEDRGIGLAWSFFQRSLPLPEDQRVPALKEAFRRQIKYVEFEEWVRQRLTQYPSTAVEPARTAVRQPPAPSMPAIDLAENKPKRSPRSSRGCVSCPHCGEKFFVTTTSESDDEPLRVKVAQWQPKQSVA